MLYVALTGNIASGKSTVARDLAARGATLIDSDQLARDVVAKGSPALDAIVAQFGPAMLTADGTLDRAAMRQRVFGDPAARNALNAIVHPGVRQLRAQRLAEARARGDRIVVADIPLLFELGMQHDFDAVILVDADETVRRHRLVALRGLSVTDAQAMIDAQMPSAQKRAEATWVIDNNGPLDALPSQLDTLWQDLEARAAQIPDRTRFRNDAS
ncbi:MAG: dephospho-CoA kinase [Gemmatimonadaceae bacterium]|nr:dephospho-CoA kinase [Gemmatimonadaceae bacterium]